MDAVLLSRIQFGLTAGYHFIFPPITLGLSLLILVIETLHILRDDEIYRTISKFLVKILGLVFVMGVATGIVLEFSFGTNWSKYSRMVGDIFGAPLAAEGVFSFFMESIFLGVLVFGRDRVSKRTYWLSALLVCFASHLSGLWIIIANSWMQTPAGYRIEGGRAYLTDFFAAVFNDSMLIRYFHTVIASWITGSLFVAGISAWHLLKGKYIQYARILLKLSIILFAILAFVQFISGHIHSVQVARTQPAKMASFEALWKTQKGAPMSIIGIPDPASEKTHLEIAVPKLLSIGIHFDPDAEVTGLDKFPLDERPPVVVTYLNYHIMIGLGSFFALLSFISIVLLLRGRLFNTRWYQYLLILAAPLPLVANEVGWMAAEIGRQPWAVYGILRTSDAVSVVVPAWQILLSILFFSVVYIFLIYIFVKLLVKIINRGPEAVTSGY